MKKYLTIVAALLMLNTASAFAQTETKTEETATCGQTVTITATPDAGYKFLYWADDHDNTNPVREVEVNADMELTTNYEAVFTAATYTVTAQVAVGQEEMGTVSGGGDYEYGATVTLTASPASKCYKFKKWSDGNTNASRTITVAATTAENTYTAEFELVDFKVTVSTSGNGSVTIAKKID